MKIALFVSSLLSSYWNGAATYYRGLFAALARRGLQLTIFEPDAFDRGAHRDFQPPDWARVVVFPATAEGMDDALSQAVRSDVVIKASGLGVLDEELIERLGGPRFAGRTRLFWDVDAPATLAALQEGRETALADSLPHLDGVLTYGGGAPVVGRYLALGARACTPVYNAHDPATHHPSEPDPALACDLALLANRLPDREARITAFFLDVARARPNLRFVLAGSGWSSHDAPSNVRVLGHLPADRHNAFNASARLVLNVSREDMARTGHSPATRVFEAAAAGSCIVTDAFDGIEAFFEPGREVLVAHSGDDVLRALDTISTETAQSIGAAARRRALSDHTYDQRAVVALEAIRQAQTRSRESRA